MRWSGVGRIEVEYWKIRPYLPSNLKSKLESFMPFRNPEQKQLKKLEMLGEEIGLSCKEVSAAYNPPLDMAHWRSRLTPFTACVMILAVFIVTFLIFTFANNHYPPSTYEFGTRYGTLKPQDFNQSRK